VFIHAEPANENGYETTVGAVETDQDTGYTRLQIVAGIIIIIIIIIN